MTLTEAWENAGRPRPPFDYCFDHPEKERVQVFTVRRITVLRESTFFEDNEMGYFDGDRISVRWLRGGSKWQKPFTVGPVGCA